MGTISINRQWRLTDEQYFKEETHKTQIVLHHTVGGSAKSTFDYWQSNPDRIATAYIIERDGTIYEVFDPLYWAHHLGLKVAKNVVYNKASIGIELASEGGLTLKDGWLYAFDGKKKLYQTTASDVLKYYKFAEPFRGFTYFDAYDAPQVAAAIALVKHLCEQFNIPKVVSNTFDFSPKWMEFKGIITHVNVREDKSDLCPGWSWDALMKGIV
jgi:N-acetyl-anhydromuramyl-L-alanine amidase AmpD